MCSQYIVYKRETLVGNIYYNPSAFFRYYIFYIMNRIYLLFHPETELGNEVFLKNEIGGFSGETGRYQK